MRKLPQFFGGSQTEFASIPCHKTFRFFAHSRQQGNICLPFWMASICTSSAIVLQEVLFLTTFRGQKMDVVAMSRILTALQIFQRHTLTSNSAKNYHGSWNKGVTIHSAVVILLRWYSFRKTMYRPAESADWCPCCHQKDTPSLC